jgi:uncharacterized membrane protein
MLFVLLLIPVATAAVVRKRFSGVAAFVAITVISSVLMSGLVVAQWWAENNYLEQQIASLDRDGDGFWSPDEKATWTAQDLRHMAAYIGDGGRNVFALLVAPALSTVYSTGVAAASVLWWRRIRPIPISDSGQGFTTQAITDSNGI